MNKVTDSEPESNRYISFSCGDDEREEGRYMISHKQKRKKKILK